MRKFLLCATFAFTLAGTGAAVAEGKDSTPASQSIDKQREAVLKEYESGEFPQQEAIRQRAKELLGREVADQTDQELTELALGANQMANLIGFVQTDYGSYYGENFQYKFIKAKIAGPHDEYLGVMNEFKGYRGQAYFNLGVRAKNRGEVKKAFFYFRDAYRLAVFDCGSARSAKTCMRWLAEQEMQSILGLSHIKAYVSWQD